MGYFGLTPFPSNGNPPGCVLHVFERGSLYFPFPVVLGRGTIKQYCIRSCQSVLEVTR